MNAVLFYFVKIFLLRYRTCGLLNLLYITQKFRIIITFVITDLQTIFHTHTHCTVMHIICLRNKFYGPNRFIGYRHQTDSHHTVTLHSTQVLPEEVSDYRKIY
jgi:hypothetical protein